MRYINTTTSLAKAIKFAKMYTSEVANLPEYLITNKTKRRLVELAKANTKGYWVLTYKEAHELFGASYRPDKPEHLTVKRVWTLAYVARHTPSGRKKVDIFAFAEY